MGAIGRASSALTFLWSSAQAHPKKAAFGAGLILPLAFPLLIFGTLASEAILQDSDFMPHFLLLISAGLVLLVISPLATLYALRFALEER